MVVSRNQEQELHHIIVVTSAEFLESRKTQEVKGQDDTLELSCFTKAPSGISVFELCQGGKRQKTFLSLAELKATDFLPSKALLELPGHLMLSPGPSHV